MMIIRKIQIIFLNYNYSRTYNMLSFFGKNIFTVKYGTTFVIKYHYFFSCCEYPVHFL